jgi:hypothetical protein
MISHITYNIHSSQHKTLPFSSLLRREGKIDKHKKGNWVRVGTYSTISVPSASAHMHSIEIPVNTAKPGPFCHKYIYSVVKLSTYYMQVYRTKFRNCPGSVKKLTLVYILD